MSNERKTHKCEPTIRWMFNVIFTSIPFIECYPIAKAIRSISIYNHIQASNHLDDTKRF